MRFSLFTCGLAILLFSGCLLGEKGSGVPVTESREVEDFDSVVLSGSGDVQVIVGESKSVTVTFDDNLVDLVQTEVRNGELRVYTTGGWSSSLGLQVEVRTPELRSATVSGAGDMVLNGVSGESLELEISGAGDLSGDGAVDSLSVEVSGVGEAELKQLQSKKATVSVSGAGDATVFATESVDASVSGTGDVEVYGNPASVKQSTSGVGDVTIVK